MSVYKRGDGKWQVLIDVDRGADGKRRRRALGTYPTRKKAEVAERDALAARDRGVDLSPARVTIAEVLHRYLGDAETRCGRKTIERYREIDRLHIAPALGAIPLAKLRPAHLSEWLSMLLREGRVNGTGLAPKTVHHAFALLKSALAWAVRMQLLTSNPALAVPAPKVARREAEAFSPDEVAQLLAAAAATRWEPLIAFAAGTGARRGEIAALKWTDVDLEKRRLTIRRSLSETREGVVEKSTKTDRVPIIPMTPLAAEALRRQKAAQAADRLASYGAFEDQGFVFAGPLGGHLKPFAMTDAFREIARKAGLRNTRLHSLRHSVGTALISEGVDARTAAALLGHSNPSTTLTIYAHLVESASTAAADHIDAFMSRLTKPKGG